MPDAEPTVAGYRRTRVLRRDALGEVYHAIHEKTSQPVCLRVLTSPEGMDAAAWKGLRYRLVGTLLSLQQVIDIPRIEAIQGVGEVDEGIWVVTDYLDGLTLEDRRQTAGPTAYSDALAILRSIAETLDQLHERGLIHGWLSADRVLVTRENEIRLLGVGLGIVPGCSHPKYAAPEREQQGPSRASDIFSFGVLLRKVIGAEQVTLPVKAVMDKLIATDPENRYKRALDAVEDLEQGKIPIPTTPTVVLQPTPRTGGEEDATPTVPLPPRPAPLPFEKAYPTAPPPVTPTSQTPVSYATPATKPAATSVPTVEMKRGVHRRPAEAAIMPATPQSRLEKVWVAAAVVLFIAALGGLYLLLTAQKASLGTTPAGSPTPAGKGTPHSNKKPTSR